MNIFVQWQPSKTRGRPVAHSASSPTQNAMNLTWQRSTDPIFGAGFELAGLPAGMSASARRCGSFRNDRPRYVANAWIGGRYLCHHAKTLRSALDRLTKEIDRRSIGLFGVDDVNFTVEA